MAVSLVKLVAARAGAHRVTERKLALDAFDAVESADPELAEIVASSAGGRDPAGHWLIRVLPSLGNVAPMEILARGGRAKIIASLAAEVV